MNSIMISEEDIRLSKEAIAKYISFGDITHGRHEAWVSASCSENPVCLLGKHPYYGKLYVCQMNMSSIVIEGDTFYSNCGLKSRYDIKSSNFTFINGDLIITAETIWGDKVEIDISPIH